MSVTQLFEPVLKDGLQTTNYFNGRLLTAEDLRTDQIANRRKRQQHGLAIGDGVATGLEVRAGSGSTGQRPVLRVSPGIAINRYGESFALNVPVDVGLFRTDDIRPDEAGLFDVCVPPAATLTNPGLYIFTIAPASGMSGRAPVVEIGSEGVATKCASRYAVEGVKFGLIPLNLLGTDSPLRDEIVKLNVAIESVAPSTNPVANPAISRLRSMAAHLCLGTEDAAERRITPYLPPLSSASFGLLEELRSGGRLTNCEVPLALVSWGRAGIQFIDSWAVRRNPAPMPVADRWSAQLSRRRSEEHLAVYLQFHTHVEELLASTLTNSALMNANANSWFRYLPPIGVLPIGGQKGSRGFDYLRFFQSKTTRPPVFIEGSATENLLRDSLAFPPIDLANPEMIWLYTVRENLQHIDGASSGPVFPVVIFTNAHIPDQNNARFDVAHWSYSNYL